MARRAAYTLAVYSLRIKNRDSINKNIKIFLLDRIPTMPSLPNILGILGILFITKNEKAGNLN